MGCVFRATRSGDGRVVALKVVKEHLSADETYRRRFLHEARAAAAVEHPHLVGVVEAGEVDGRQFLAMAYCEGETLDHRVRETGALSAAAVVRLGVEVGGALAALHGAGLVHRDVKAANILLGAGGAATLTDLGLAKGEGYSVLTAPGSIVGTIDYLAPERIHGETATPASDVYGLGCVLVEALTGQPPFGGKSMMEVAFAHLEAVPEDPAATRDDVAPGIGAAVLATLAKSPSERPPALELVERLQAATTSH